MKRAATTLLVAAFSLAGTLRLEAHHSHGTFYDQCRILTIEGRIEAVQWKMPHSRIDVKTDAGTTYRAEWTGEQILMRAGVFDVANASLQSGTRIVVIANPQRSAAEVRARFPEFKGFTDQNVDLRQVRRADGSWSWGETPTPQAECAGR
jgi:hypothetical protein